MKRILTTVVLIVIVLVLLCIGVALGKVFFSKITVTTNVTEPISFPTSSITVDVPVGGSVYTTFEVVNSGDIDIPLEFSSNVSLVPDGGNVSDLAITLPVNFVAKPGNSIFGITLTASTSAVVGSYEVEIIPSR